MVDIKNAKDLLSLFHCETIEELEATVEGLPAG